MKFIIFSILLVVVSSAVINRNISPSETATDTPPCSTNASSAYVDIILLIDTSSNMGTSNLRKIGTSLSLILPQFTIGNQPDITQGYRNTRIAIITFDTEAKIVANYTNINNFNDAATLLNGLSASTSKESNLYDGIKKAIYIQTNCSDPSNCMPGYNYVRPTAMIVFAAAANSASVADVPNLVNEADFFDDGTIITVNFNTANSDLTILLNYITYDSNYNMSMYNFTGSSKTLAQDLSWAILQANCYCGDVGGINAVYYNQATGRYERNAECMFLEQWEGQDLNGTIEMCRSYESNDGIQTTPVFILSPTSETFIQSIWVTIDPFTGQTVYPFYFGLHQNKEKPWSFYDYDGSEFPVTNYTKWAPGFPKGSNGCAVLDSDNGVTFVWKNFGCDTGATGLDKALCHGKACDASSTSCCANCNMNNSEAKENKSRSGAGKRGKKSSRHVKKMEIKNGKAVRIN